MNIILLGNRAAVSCRKHDILKFCSYLFTVVVFTCSPLFVVTCSPLCTSDDLTHGQVVYRVWPKTAMIFYLRSYDAISLTMVAVHV
jgi:hypothetical protein